MNFVDKVTVKVAAGNGGNGSVSFRREKYISHGGPDGGDGGKGGDIVFLASNNQSTLATFRYQRELVAESGERGDQRRKHGKNGKSLTVNVPVGTIAMDEKGQVLADLTTDGEQVVIAPGGLGGFGNAHFVSSTRQSPKFAEKGEPGTVLTLTLELKMIADVGLVGLPNAGKSTLLGRISNAKPEIADYPFTTLIPNLGVVDVDDHSILFADIPGLIEGAAEGKGLGHDFLRHIERTAVIVHLIDAYSKDLVKAYQTIQNELKAYSKALAKLPQIVVINKIDGLDAKIIGDLEKELRKVVPKSVKIYAISASAGTGLDKLLFAIKEATIKQRTKLAAKRSKETVPVLTLADNSEQWTVSKTDGHFMVSGPKIDRFAKRTDFGNEEATQRLRDVMRRLGIFHELDRQGIKPGQSINVANCGRLDY
jgi:GTP-binding protein